MGISAGVVLLAVGAVLAFAVSGDVTGLSLDGLGLILMIGGAAVLIWSSLVASRNRPRARGQR